MSARVVVIGDALLDRDVEGHSERLCPDAPVPVVDQDADRPRPGGAGLAAALAAGAGAEVTLVTALADDDAGAALARELAAAEIDLVELRLQGATPEKVRVICGGEPLLRLDRGRGGAVLADGAGRRLRAALAGAGAVLVSDYGHGVAGHPEVRRALAGRPPTLPLAWDPHPRGAPPVAGATLVTPNLAEAAGFCGRPQPAGEAGAAELALQLARRWRAGGVCVTRGGGAALYAERGGRVRAFPCRRAQGDSCGAGDRFAAELAAELARGAPAERAIPAAVEAASAFVAAGGAGGLERPLSPPPPAAGGTDPQRSVGPGAPYSLAAACSLAGAVRRRGGTVVASGGCFDLLHLGHARTLEAARRLGDCLIVLLNGDRSVRRLKGPERPLVGELERAALLEALGCVDAVAIFDQPDPRAALRRLRPDVWAKGGDYDAERLPERELIASWGGRVALLPYLEGRSTSGLIEEVGQRVA